MLKGSSTKKLEQWAIVKMAERASNVANDWTKGRGGRGGAKEKDILEKLDNNVYKAKEKETRDWK